MEARPESRHQSVGGHLGLVVIAGVTASGKSALALTLARALDAVIINADRVQLYADLPTLTARPSRADEAAAEHRLYGILGPERDCSAHAWLAMARSELKAAHEAGRPALVVGGSGLYLAALLDGLSPIPDIDDDVRASVRGMDHQAVSDRLEALDPKAHGRLAANDLHRRARALEVVLATGRPISDWQQVASSGERPRAAVIALLPDRALIRQRIRRRMQAMVNGHACLEMELLARRAGDPRFMPIAKTHGLAELMAWRAGQMDAETAIQRTAIRVGQYAKRQETWIRHKLRPHETWTAFGEDIGVDDRKIERILTQSPALSLHG